MVNKQQLCTMYQNVPPLPLLSPVFSSSNKSCTISRVPNRTTIAQSFAFLLGAIQSVYPSDKNINNPYLTFGFSKKYHGCGTTVLFFGTVGKHFRWISQPLSGQLQYKCTEIKKNLWPVMIPPKRFVMGIEGLRSRRRSVHLPLGNSKIENRCSQS